MKIIPRTQLHLLGDVPSPKSVMAICNTEKFTDREFDLIHKMIARPHDEKANWIGFAGIYGEFFHDCFDELDIAHNLYAVTSWHVSEDDAADYFIATPGKRLVVTESDNDFQSSFIAGVKDQIHQLGRKWT